MSLTPASLLKNPKMVKLDMQESLLDSLQKGISFWELRGA